MAYDRWFITYQKRGGADDGEWFKVNAMHILKAEPDGNYIKFDMVKGGDIKTMFPVELLKHPEWSPGDG